MPAQLLCFALLLGVAGPCLAQTAANDSDQDPTGNAAAPFVRNLRPDRPGRTVTTNMLRPGQFLLEVSSLRETPAAGPSRLSSAGLLRIGFFNHMELRVTQNYRHDNLPASDAGAPRWPGLAPLTVGAKWLASTNQDARNQVLLLTELTLPKTGTRALHLARPVAAGRLLVSQQLGRRFGVEGNFGFSQSGFRAADTKVGQFLYTLALNGPLGRRCGFFAEGYGAGRGTYSYGSTAGLNWRPWSGLRLDVAAARTFRGPQQGSSVTAGLSLRLPR